MAPNITQNYVRYVTSVIIIAEKELKVAKEVSLTKNSTGMDI